MILCRVQLGLFWELEMSKRVFPENGTDAQKIRWMQEQDGFVDYGALNPCTFCGYTTCVCLICPDCDKREGECSCKEA